MDESFLNWEFFDHLVRFDKQIARAVAAGRCPHCGGPLHRANYLRKPRGSWMAQAGEEARLRQSLCCGRRGCRKRALPPSLLFLGRRVYLEVVVIFATVLVGLLGGVEQAVRRTGMARHTLRRWYFWWTTTLPALPYWSELRARFAPPPPAGAELPQSLLERLCLDLGLERAPVSRAGPLLEVVARLLAPLTTGSVRDGARYLRDTTGMSGTA